MANITIKKVYVEVLDNTEITHIRLELYYTTDKYNQFTHRPIISGYRIVAVPTKVEEHVGTRINNVTYKYKTETTSAFSGFTETIWPCSRKSPKSEKEALRIFEERQSEFIDWFKDKYNLKIKEDVKSDRS